MNISDVMTTRVETCSPGTDLATVAMILWWNDCGVAPVVDPETGRVVGMITDRDICMAVATRHCSPDALRVEDVFQRDLASVSPGDPVSSALEIMESRQVRRVPAVDEHGKLAGIVSLTDLVRRAEATSSRTRQSLSAKDLLRVLKAIGQRRQPAALQEAGTSQG